MKKKLKWFDLTILLILPILAILISVYLVNLYLISTLLFYGLPGLYLALRFGHVWQEEKAVLFAVLVSTPFAIIVDYIGIKSWVWYTTSSLFDHRFLNTIPYEDFFWMAVATYTMIVIYQTLLEPHDKKEIVDNRMLHFLLSALFVLGCFFSLLIVGHEKIFAFDSKYTYLFLGSVFFLLPSALFLMKFPKFLKKLWPLSLYFLYLTTLFEITATYLNQWIFNGEYFLPPIDIFHRAPVALEELIFVGLVGPIAAVAFYEFFDNGRKRD
mgnify:FL=1